MVDFNNKINILHIVVWIIAFITAWIAFFISQIITVSSDYNLYAHHFTCAAVYANVAISTCILCALILDEEFPEKTLMIFNVSATITYIIAAGIYFAHYSDTHTSFSDHTTSEHLELCNGILCLILAILNFAEFLMGVLNKK